MAEGEAKRTIAAHGDAADRSIPAAAADAVFALNRGDELLQKEIAVANRTIGGVDVETSSAFWSNDEKIANLMFLPEIIQQRPSSAVEEGLLVVAEPVKKIEDWVALRGSFLSARIIAGRQVNAVMDRILENLAV